jgi:hypothetical protein
MMKMKELDYDDMTLEQRVEFWQGFVTGLGQTMNEYRMLFQHGRRRVKELEFQCDAYKVAAEEWMKKHDELKAKYEPEILTTAR